MEDIEKAYAAINAHPGKVAHDLWSNLKRTYLGIFVRNRKDLLLLLDKPNKNEDLRIELIQNVQAQTAKEDFISEMLRLLHNYIASSASLIDHSRRFIEKYPDSDFSKNYQIRRTAIASSPEHCFLKDLRNYIVHFDIPPIGYQVSFNGDSFEPRLTSKRLLRRRKWSSTSKSYIETSGEYVNIIPLVNDHSRCIDDLYSWIFEQFQKIHGDDIAEVNKLIRETLPDYM